MWLLQAFCIMTRDVVRAELELADAGILLYFARIMSCTGSQSNPRPNIHRLFTL